MPRANILRNNFTAGEVTPRLAQRFELTAHKNGCDTLLNMLVRPHGGVARRPGTIFVAAAKDQARAAKLLSFRYSSTDAYVIEASESYLRFFTPAGAILDGNGLPYEVASPYTAAQSRAVQYVQSADVLFMVHPEVAPQTVSRYAATNWTIAPSTVTWPPFREEGTSLARITASAVTGTGITLTASAATFTADDVGGWFQLRELTAGRHPAWEPDRHQADGGIDAYALGSTCLYDGKVYKNVSASQTRSGKQPPVHEEGTQSDGRIDWEFLHWGKGYVYITAVASGTSATATVAARLPDSVVSEGTARWSRSAWGAGYGYPRAIGFSAGRLFYGGEADAGYRLHGSAVEAYSVFRGGDKAADSIELSLVSSDVQTIQWIEPLNKTLGVGTDSTEWAITSGKGGSDVIAPDSVAAAPYTTHGAAWERGAMHVENSILYVDRSRKRVMAMRYYFDRDAHDSQDLTLMSEHITGAGVADWAWQTAPEQVLWLVTDDGALVSCTYYPQHEVIGWARHQVGDAVESVAVIPSADGVDQVWLLVRRTINGATVRNIERLAPEIGHTGDVASAIYVDCAAVTTAAAGVVSGLQHLEGQTVAGLADGRVFTGKAVYDGRITLDGAPSSVVVGIPYWSTVSPTNIDAGAPDGSSQGRRRQVIRASVDFLRSGPAYWGRDGTDLTLMRGILAPDTFGTAALDLFTGKITGKYESGFADDVRVVVSSNAPLPMEIRSISTHVDVGMG